MTSMCANHHHRISYADPTVGRPTPTRLAEPADRPKPVALIVDQDADFRYITTLMLESIGYDVVAISNAIDALGTLGTPPTLIVTEVRAGLHDPAVIPAQLRCIPAFERTPMIVCSGWPFPEDRAIARSVGADLFMTVPVDFRAIRTRAAELISDPRDTPTTE